MSTQRLGADQIIASDLPGGGTVRVDNAIISSMPPQQVQNQQVISSSLTNEIVLNNNKYSIVKQIARSGEAEVFLVTYNTTNLVFKYYYSQYKPKDEILVKLKGLRHPYIIALYDYGYHKDRFFEISEYAQGGTLTDNMPMTTLQKTRETTEQIIEGLNYCHTKGIIHRDIKPENIFYRTTFRKEIAIGDFGIASNLKEGEELVRTSMARTSLYAAPELFTNIQGKTTIEKSVDFYALGMSLLHLWFGRDPFEDVDEFGIMRLKSEGRVLFPDNIHDDVEKLIKGLITVNPRDRWGYEEIKRWLNGDDVKVHYQTISFDYKPYAFGFIDGEQIVVNNPQDLIFYLEKYPERGEGHLYRNSIAKWVETVDPGLFNDLMDIVEKEFPRDRSAGLTKAIYILDQERPFRGFDKTKLRTQEEIAAHFEKNFDHYIQDLQNPNAPFYVFLESRNYKTNADEYRNYFKIANPEAALNTLIFKLEGSDKLVLGKYVIYQPEELLRLDYDTKEEIVRQLSNLNSKLSIWISGFKNLQNSIEKWHQLKDFNETTLRYALRLGFEFNGFTATDNTEFYTLLKNNFQSFFSENAPERNRSAANYWLKNYMATSLSRVAMDYMRSETYSDKEFIQLLDYSLRNCEETRMDLYQVSEYLLPYIKNKKSDNKKTGNKILLNNVADVFQNHIEEYWQEQSKKSALLFKENLEAFVGFASKNQNTYPELFSQLVQQLEDTIRKGIMADFNLIKADEAQTIGYRDDLGKLLERFGQLNMDLAYLKRYNNENVLINKFRLETRKKNIKEKENKIKITNEKFDKILEKYKAKYKDNTKEKLNEKIYKNLAVAFLGVVLLIAIFLYNEEIPVTIISLAAIIAATLFGSRIGNNIGARITKAEDEKNMPGELIGLYVGLLLAYHFSGSIPVEKGLNSFGLYTQVPIEFIALVALVLLAVFAGRAYMLNKKYHKEINEIGLKPEEKAALDQNMIDIEKYFKDKEAFDTYQETLRVINLDDTQFDQEFSRVKTSA